MCPTPYNCNNCLFLGDTMETRSLRTTAEVAELAARYNEIEILDLVSDDEVDHVEYESGHDCEENTESEEPEEQPLRKRRRTVTRRSIVKNEENETDNPEDKEVIEGQSNDHGAAGSRSFARAKSGYIWHTKNPKRTGRRSLPPNLDATSVGEALNVTTPLEAWSLLFSDDILEKIVVHTNEEIKRATIKLRANGSEIKAHHREIDIIELRSFIGLLYMAGFFKVSLTSTKVLWLPHSMPIFKVTMSMNRFTFLASCLRFDDKSTRTKRQKSDQFAPVREIWDLFIANCMKYYQPGSECTIDEQLLSFRGKCAFKVCMPNKPVKCGIKVVMLNDAITHYMYNAIPHVGTVKTLPEESVPTFYVRKLAEPIYDSRRTITCDSWFTSVPLFDSMKEKNLTMIGTIRKNEPHIPKLFKSKPTNGNVQLGYHDDKTLVSYHIKPKKIVLLLSNKGTVIDKMDDVTDKPVVFMEYEKYNGGTNAFDQKCRDFTVTRGTNRWSMRMFYGMLDHANVNSFILYMFRELNDVMTRQDFMFELANSLIQPELKRRLLRPGLHVNMRSLIKTFLTNDELSEPQDPRDLLAENKMASYKRCSLCPSSLDRKTQYMCLGCRKAMCKSHTAKICVECTPSEMV